MKKIILSAVLLTFVFASCKKKQDNPSITVTASFPTITFKPTKYFSIPVGGTLPRDIATAYDSFYKESLSVILIDSSIHNLVPGLYRGVATAQSKYGYVSTASYYVAVTNISSSMDLSGNWFQMPDSVNTSTSVQKLAAGFYKSSNATGTNMITDAEDVTPALFVVTDDTTLVFGSPISTTGKLNTAIHILGDTTMTYDPGTGPITFSKQ